MMINAAMKEKLDGLFSAMAGWAPLFVRLTLGIVFVAHGADKLFGSFGGGGFNSTVDMMHSLHMEPANFFAWLAGGGELLGGILVFLGLLTRFGGFLIANTMVVAIVSVHLQAGLFARDGGFEYPLVALGAALALICSGSGKLSLGSLLCKCSAQPSSEPASAAR
jgi:putative oxidoreductase